MFCLNAVFFLLLRTLGDIISSHSLLASHLLHTLETGFFRLFVFCLEVIILKLLGLQQTLQCFYPLHQKKKKGWVRIFCCSRFVNWVFKRIKGKEICNSKLGLCLHSPFLLTCPDFGSGKRCVSVWVDERTITYSNKATARTVLE